MVRRAPVTLALAGLCMLLCVAGEPFAVALAWHRDAILDGEIWRLWTGHLVHYSTSHASADALALFAMGGIVEPVLGARRLGMMIAGGAASISLGLVAWVPGMLEYRGASGLAMLAATLAGALAWRRPGLRLPVAGAAVALLSAAMWAAWKPGMSVASLPGGVAVAWQAHVLGVLAGAGAALCSKAGAVKKLIKNNHLQS